MPLPIDRHVRGADHDGLLDGLREADGACADAADDAAAMSAAIEGNFDLVAQLNGRVQEQTRIVESLTVALTATQDILAVAYDRERELEKECDETRALAQGLTAQVTALRDDLASSDVVLGSTLAYNHALTEQVKGLQSELDALKQERFEETRR